MVRVHRKPLERVIGLFRGSARVRCRDTGCAWEGVVYGGLNSRVLQAAAWFALALFSVGVSRFGSFVFDRLGRTPSEGEAIPAGEAAPQ
jgi:hypothetical protein